MQYTDIARVSFTLVIIYDNKLKYWGNVRKKQDHP